MIVDDWYDELDEDSDVVETVDELFARLRSYKVVKLDFYRKMAKEYRGWKPLPIEEFVARLELSQIEIIKRELDKARKTQNNRVAKINKLPPTK